MVFKKPYALLIKYFKLIHIIITVLIAYVIYKMTKIITFFNEYVSNGWKSINDTEIASFINPSIYICIFAIIIFSIIIYLLMRFKKKPRLYYLLTPILYLIIFIVMLVTSSILKSAQFDVISPITSRAIRDILLIFTGLQFVFIVFSLLRAIGFDVKKFNFKKDIADLEISELDNEEVEVGFEIEKYKINRKLNRKIRNIKYIFLEHKFIWLSLLTIIITSIVGFIVINTFIINKTYNQNNIVQLDRYSINVKNSYLTSLDTKNNEISNYYKYVVVDTTIYNSIEKNTFNTDNLTLEINNKIYFPYSKGYSKFKDYGIGYTDGKVLQTKQQNQYIFVFKIPEDINLKKIYLKYLYKTTYKKGISTNEYKKIKLNILNNSSKKIEKNLNEKLYFNNNTLKIKSYEFNNQYTYTYKFCSSENNCIDSKGFINTTLGNNKSILKLDVDYKFNENEPNLNFDNIGNFFRDYATIKYMKNDKYYIQKTINNLTPDNINKNEIYLEATSDIQNSKYISIEFKNKGINYSYILKNE